MKQVGILFFVIIDICVTLTLSYCIGFLYFSQENIIERLFISAYQLRADQGLKRKITKSCSLRVMEATVKENLGCWSRRWSRFKNQTQDR